MLIRRTGLFCSVPQRSRGRALSALLFGILILTAPALARSQNFVSDSIMEVHPTPPKPAPASALVFEGLASFGNYNLFASGTGDKLYTAGIEYDRHSWGEFMGAEMDYVAEVLPLVLLNQSVKTNLAGFPMSPQRKTIPGFGFSPIGMRLLWRPGSTFQPYLEEKGGMLLFSQKALEKNASYENFSMQSSLGVLVRTHGRFDLRVGLYSDFHFSNAFIVPVNPGLDVMNANFGLSYELGRRSRVE